jgi:hypothetical protein
MTRSKQDCPEPSKGDRPPAVRAEPGETVALSPQSDRFSNHYRRVQPRSAREARELIGLSDEMTHALREHGACCQPDDKPYAAPAPEELESEDEQERGRAFEDAGRSFATLLTTTSPELLSPMEPAIARYLDLTKLELNVVTLQDIEVADGATLSISDDTHLVEANNIVIRGTGQIKCSGFTKMNVNSIEGTT